MKEPSQGGIEGAFVVWHVDIVALQKRQDLGLASYPGVD